jgi:hypothetical protein
MLDVGGRLKNFKVQLKTNFMKLNLKLLLNKLKE